MRIWIALLVLAASVLPTGIGHAQGAGTSNLPPAHKSALRDWHWWAGEAVILAAVSADGVTSCRAFSHGGTESGILGRGSSSCKWLAVKLTAGASFYTILHGINHSIGVDSDPRWLRLEKDIAVPLPVGLVHGLAALHNTNLPTAQACPAGLGCAQWR